MGSLWNLQRRLRIPPVFFSGSFRIEQMKDEDEALVQNIDYSRKLEENANIFFSRPSNHILFCFIFVLLCFILFCFPLFLFLSLLLSSIFLSSSDEIRWGLTQSAVTCGDGYFQLHCFFSSVDHSIDLPYHSVKLIFRLANHLCDYKRSDALSSPPIRMGYTWQR